METTLSEALATRYDLISLIHQIRQMKDNNLSPEEIENEICYQSIFLHLPIEIQEDVMNFIEQDG